MRTDSFFSRLLSTALSATLIVLSPGLPFYSAWAGPAAIGATSGPAPGAYAAWGPVLQGFLASPGMQAYLQNLPGGKAGDSPLAAISGLDFRSPHAQKMGRPFFAALEAQGLTPEAFASLPSEEKKRETVLSALDSAIREVTRRADAFLQSTRNAGKDMEYKAALTEAQELADLGHYYLDLETHEQILFAVGGVRQKLWELRQNRTRDTIRKETKDWGTNGIAPLAKNGSPIQVTSNLWQRWKVHRLERAAVVP